VVEFSNLRIYSSSNDRFGSGCAVGNLFNEHYEDPTGFLRPGIGVFMGVKFTN
jgi:hypothetical protein